MNNKIRVSEPYIIGNEKKYICDAIDSGMISFGKYVDLFEKEFAKFIGSKYAVSCANGTVALHLALRACNITKKDNIILPTHSFIASAEAAKYCTDDITYVDIDNETLNINPEKIKVKKNTKAIMPVHLYGNPCDMDKIMKIAKDNNLYVVEDACESLGAVKLLQNYDVKIAGTFGDIGVFSFYGNKLITTGEGGMCITDNEKLYNKMISLRHHAETKERYVHDDVGYNYRMSNIQAAMGLAQLENIHNIIHKKTLNNLTYKKYLIKFKDIRFIAEYKNYYSINWLFTILFKNKKTRDAVEKALTDNNIETRRLFRPMNSMMPYGKKKIEKDDISNIGLNLPTACSLKEEDIKRICKIVGEVLEKR